MIQRCQDREPHTAEWRKNGSFTVVEASWPSRVRRMIEKIVCQQMYRVSRMASCTASSQARQWLYLLGVEITTIYNGLMHHEPTP